MKRTLYPLAFIVAAICIVSCHKENKKVKVEEIPVFNEPDPPVWTFDSVETELGTVDFDTFDIERDYTELSEKVHTDPSKKMYVENSVFEDVINIKYSGDKALVTNDNTSDFTVQTNGAHVTINTTKDVALTLTGKSENGSLKILGGNRVRINLNGVNLKNPKGPSINSQSKELCFLVTDSSSVLSDDSVYAEADKGEKQKGCICSKGSLSFSGHAPLKIIANGADAIHSGKTIFIRRGSNIDIDSHFASAIKAKNKVKIEGGMVNINSTGSGGHGITARKEVLIAGGRTTIISDTGAGKDGKNSRCIKSDSLVTITGGIVRVKDSSVGGKGIRAGHKFLAKNCMVDVLTYGTDDKVTGSKNRGIKAVEEIRIDSARVRVRTENGWNEGLSCRQKIIISNSLVELNTRDDAISAGDTKLADIEINNARLFAVSGMDAIDSNGTLHINSGLIYVIARSKLCRGFDCDFKEFKIGPEATVVSLGQITSNPTVDLLEHPACFVTLPLHGTTFCLSTTGANDNIVSFQPPKFMYTDTVFNVMLSVPEFKQNASYDFCRSATVKPKHTFHNLSLGGTATNKSVISSHSFTKNYDIFKAQAPIAQTLIVQAPDSTSAKVN